MVESFHGYSGKAWFKTEPGFSFPMRIHGSSIHHDTLQAHGHQDKEYHEGCEQAGSRG